MRRLVILIAVSLVALAAAITMPAPPARAAATAPKDWNCAGQAPGDTVQLAPLLADDTNPDGTAVKSSPDRRGKYVPIVMVHGWVGQDTHDGGRKGVFSGSINLTPINGQQAHTTRSLIGQLQRLPGAAVFTFDYRDYAARWVTDDHLGPALGRVIDCLYKASGGKVIVVAHSMGGLIARYVSNTPGRASEISTVVTFGTPETGSIAAMLGAGVVDILPVDSPLIAALRLFLAVCGRVTSDEIVPGTLCGAIPQLGAFDSDAGRALRYGSPELAALKPFPAGITVDALGGGTILQAHSAGWFTIPWSSPALNVGDIAVTLGSALHASTLHATATCTYEMNPQRTGTDQIGVLLKLTASSEIGRPIWEIDGPCFHNNLTRDIVLTNEATGAIADDIAARAPVTAADLLSAPVPAACHHKAGTLVKGRLPGIPANQGGMELGWLGGKPSSATLALGDLTGDGVPDAAAVLDCNAGGVPWPQLVAFYRTGPILLGAISLGDVTLPGHIAGENTVINTLTYAGGTVKATWTTQQDDDPACCGTFDYSATLGWNGKKITTTQVTATTERPTAEQFTAAVAHGDSATAGALAASGVASQALRLAAGYGHTFDTKPTCVGLNGNMPDAVYNLADRGVAPHAFDADRFCYIRAAEPNGDNYIVLGMKHTGYRQWQVSWIDVA